MSNAKPWPYSAIKWLAESVTQFVDWTADRFKGRSASVVGRRFPIAFLTGVPIGIDGVSVWFSTSAADVKDEFTAWARRAMRNSGCYVRITAYTDLHMGTRAPTPVVAFFADIDDVPRTVRAIYSKFPFLKNWNLHLDLTTLANDVLRDV